MIIQCTKCGTRFRLDSPKPGTKVRCSTCQNMFEVATPELPPMPQAAPKPTAKPADDLELDIDFDDEAPKPAAKSAAAPAAKRADDDIGFADADLLGGDAFDDVSENDAPTITKTVPGLLQGDETVITTGLAARNEAKAEAKPAAAPAAKPEPKPEAKPAPKPEAKPAPKAEPKAEPKPKSKPLPGFLDESRAVTKVGQIPNLARVTGELKVEAPSAEPAPAAQKARTYDASAHVPDLAAELGGEDFFAGAGLALDGTVVPPRDSQAGRPTAVLMDTAPTRQADPPRATMQAKADAPRLTETAPKATPLNVVVQVLVSLVLVVVLSAGVLVFLSGGSFDRRLLTFDGRAWSQLTRAHAPVSFESVRVVSMRSVLYPVSPSMSALVFFGEAENQGDKIYRDLEITAEVRNSQGNVLAHAKGPVGIALTPRELLGLPSDEAVRIAFRKKATASPELMKLGPGARVPYMAVITAPPDGADVLVHEVLLGQGATYVEPPPPPAPEPVPEPVAELPKKGKMKGKAKGKKRP